MDTHLPIGTEHDGNPVRLLAPFSSAFSTAFEAGLVSVIIPTYNREQFLDQTIASVVAQEYRPIEIIVVDDGSSDNTKELISTWRRELEDSAGLELRYIFQNNSGAPAARNRGMLESRGEFLQFLDSDDCLHRSKIDLHVKSLEHRPTADFAYGPIKELEDPAHTIYCQSEMTPRKMALKQVVNPAFQTSGPLCRRSMFAKVGMWNEGIAPMEDWELFARATVMGCLGAYVRDAIVYHRMDVADRLRWKGDKKRLEQYLNGRFVQLESMLAHASSALRHDRQFCDLIAMELTRVVSKGIVSGWNGDFTYRLCQARSITKSPSLLIILASASLVRRNMDEVSAAHYFLIFPWIYFRFRGSLARLRRLISGLPRASVY